MVSWTQWHFPSFPHPVNKYYVYYESFAPYHNPTHICMYIHWFSPLHFLTSSCLPPLMFSLHSQVNWPLGLRKLLISCFESWGQVELWSQVIEWLWCFDRMKLLPLSLHSMAVSLLLSFQSVLNHPLPKKWACLWVGEGVGCLEIFWRWQSCVVSLISSWWIKTQG